MRTLYLTLAVLTFAVCVVHASPWTHFIESARPLPVELGLPHTHYLLIDSPFWTAAFAGLALAFLGEGLTRRSRRHVD
jgi:hypothetical protein